MKAHLSRNESYKAAAHEFAGKLRRLASPREIAIVGSVAGGDPHPNDLDVAVVVTTLDELHAIAKSARQMSRLTHAWEVFLFDEDLSPIGRVCHRRECPGTSVDCIVEGCGKPLHLRVHTGFTYDENIFFGSPIDVLWTAREKSLLLARREMLGITALKEYPALEDMEVACMDCGDMFVFSGGERKWYDKRGLCWPKRCAKCRDRECM